MSTTSDVTMSRRKEVEQRFMSSVTRPILRNCGWRGKTWQLGQTRAGRSLVGVSVERGTKVRAVTAYDAPASYRKLLQEARMSYVREISDTEL